MNQAQERDVKRINRSQKVAGNGPDKDEKYWDNKLYKIVILMICLLAGKCTEIIIIFNAE